ncbi:MAG: hypothetical protein PHS59_16665 [Paludibacter sp.]|nr:hypothetical protein [Paludibacter sp.]
MKFLKYFLSLIVLFQLSCKDSHEYRVDTEFTQYLQRFEDEAAKKDKYFDLESTGLIIEFANLKDNIAGLTHYEQPIRIEIDKTYWNEIKGYQGEDLMKENLIFHELGHGLLNRDHLNTTLENGDWKSIMCGGTMVDNRNWNINYRGMRRTYYIDELFNESTPAPEFSSNTLLEDTTDFVEKLFLSFDDEEHAGWPIKDSTNYTTSINEGKLQFQSKVEKLYLVFAKTDIDIQSDFSYELTLKYESTSDENYYGILFGYLSTGNSDGSTDPIEYFSIDNKQSMYVGNRSWYSYYTELKKPSIIKNGDNKLKIVKIGDLLYYFINNVYEYCSEMETIESGDSFGFIVPPNGTVLLDNFKISKRNSSGAPSKMKQINQIQFGMKEVKAITLKKYNQ